MHYKTFIYGAYDKLRGRFLDIVQEDNVVSGIRSLLLSMKVPLKDTLLYELGCIVHDYPEDAPEIPLSSLSITWYNSPRLCSWSYYSLPATPAEAISPLGAAAQIAETRSRVSNNPSRSEVSNKVGTIYG